jgi:hypothetical protein
MEDVMLETLILLGGVTGCLAVVAAPLPPAETIDPQGRGAVARRRGELAVALGLLIGSAAAMLSLLAISYGRMQLLLPLALTAAAVALVAYPWALVRVAIRVGAWRTAKVLGRRAHPWLRDPTGGAVLGATLALLGRGDSNAFTRNTLRRCLADAPLRGAGIVALGLLEAMAGRVDAARRLLESIELLDPADCPPLASRIAIDWRVADASARGCWGEVRRIASSAHRPSRTTRLVTAAAQRLTGESISTRTLWRAWLVAPRRLSTWSLLQRALVEEPRPIADELLRELAANDGGATELRAMSLHHETLGVAAEGLAGSPHLLRLGAAWDACLDDWDFRRRVRARAETLGTELPPDRLLGVLRADVAQDMADILPPEELAQDDFDDARGVLARALELSQRRGYQRLRIAVAKLAAMREPARPTPSWDVWSQWSQAVAGYGEAVRCCDAQTRQAVFSDVEPELAATAGCLSHCGERPAAAAMSLWLVQEADRVRDLPAAAHHRAWLVLG